MALTKLACFCKGLKSKCRCVTAASQVPASCVAITAYKKLKCAFGVRAASNGLVHTKFHEEQQPVEATHAQHDKTLLLFSHLRREFEVMTFILKY